MQLKFAQVCSTPTRYRCVKLSCTFVPAVHNVGMCGFLPSRTDNDNNVSQNKFQNKSDSFRPVTRQVSQVSSGKASQSGGHGSR